MKIYGDYLDNLHSREKKIIDKVVGQPYYILVKYNYLNNWYLGFCKVIKHSKGSFGDDEYIFQWLDGYNEEAGELYLSEPIKARFFLDLRVVMPLEILTEEEVIEAEIAGNPLDFIF